MNYRHVLILGDARFLGSHLVSHLAHHYACSMTIVATDYAHVAHLMQLPNVSIFVGDVNNEEVLDVLIRNVDVVINLTDVWYSRRPGFGKPYGKDFERQHVTLTSNIVAGCQKYGIERYIHLSAFGVSDPELSAYYQSKLDGEEAALGSDLKVTILRPSVMFGTHDHFFTTLAQVQKHLMVVPLQFPTRQFQPVYVGNVVQAITYALSHDDSIGKVYSLVGPKKYTVEALVKLTGQWSGHAKSIWQCNAFCAYFLRFVLPKKYRMQGDYIYMQFANKIIDERIAQSFAEEFQITLRTIEDIVPNYLAPAEE